MKSLSPTFAVFGLLIVAACSGAPEDDGGTTGSALEKAPSSDPAVADAGTDAKEIDATEADIDAAECVVDDDCAVPSDTAVCGPIQCVEGRCIFSFC